MDRLVVLVLAATVLQWYVFFLTSQYLFVVPLGLLTSSLGFLTGFVARPVGGFLIGRVGDTLGRRFSIILPMALLIASSLLMLVNSIPTLFTSRVLQGLSLGGEWGGASTMVMESHHHPRLRVFLASLVQLGVPVGLALSSITTYLVLKKLINWSTAYLASSMSSLVVLLAMLGFREEVIMGPSPIGGFLRELGSLIRGVGFKVGESSVFYLYAVLTLLGGHGAYTSMVIAASSLLQVILIPIFGYLTSVKGFRLVTVLGVVVAALGLVVLSLGDVSSAIPILVIADSALYAPQSSVLPTLFRREYRVAATNLTYQLASAIGGGLTPMLMLVGMPMYAAPTPFVAMTLIAALLIKL